MPIDPADARAAELAEEVAELNTFLASRRIDGVAFGGLRRIFSDGDQPGFNWRWGGRFYSLPPGDAYELWKGGFATRTASIRIENETIGEVDISASHLTLLYAMMGVSIDPTKDPYEVEGVVRNKVKRWLTVALGKGSVAANGQWYRRVREATLIRHPVLRGLESLGVSTLDLQYHESEILRSALSSLMQKNVVALPIHDGLIVAVSQLELAKEALSHSFSTYVEHTFGAKGLTARIRIERA